MKPELEQSRKDGLEEGIEKGRNNVNTLILFLLQNNRLEDLRRAAEDADYQNRLFEEFGLRILQK